MYSFIDTHTHLYDEAFAPDREAVVARAFQAGAQKLFLPNCDESTLPLMMDLVARHPGRCYPMLGLHPTEMPADPEPFLRSLERRLAGEHPFIAIGEVGLDFYWDTSRKAEQIKVFMRQVDWALTYGLPLMIHCRAAMDEMLRLLFPYRNEALGGVFHCFTGTAEDAAKLLAFPRFALGIGGVLTFKKSTLPQVLPAAVPLSRIVLETDAPYMAPVPLRGKRNEPSFLPYVIDRLAECYDTDAESVCRQTTLTAMNIFPRCRQA